jgi:hypothetical protein
LKAAANIISHYATSFRSLIGTGSKKSKNLLYVRMGALGKSSSGRLFQSKDNMQTSERDGMRQSHRRDQTSITIMAGLNDNQEPLRLLKGGIGYSRQVDVV